MFFFDEFQCFLTVLGIAYDEKTVFLPRNHLFQIGADEKIIVRDNHFVQKEAPSVVVVLCLSIQAHSSLI